MTAGTINPLLFGLNIDPSAARLDLALRLAALADGTGYDLLGVQDHPYIPTHLDSWTLLSVLGARTERVRLLPDVLNLALRPPAVLAKAAATLDVVTGGRFELGLGSGAFWDGIAGFGGPRRAPGEAVESLEEAMRLMRALWAPGREPVTFEGRHYRLSEAKFGPRPAHEIGIWLGVARPRMLRLTGRLADGWLISNGYVPPEQLPGLQAVIDGAADAAGRPRSAIRRAYNLFGVVLAPDRHPPASVRQGALVGTSDTWAAEIARFAGLGMDSFIFWPVGGDEEAQARRFAEEVIPAVRAAIVPLS